MLKNNRSLFLATLALLASAMAWAETLSADTPRIVSFVTTDGESIDNAKITRVEPDGLSVMLPTGIVKIPVEQLPDDLRSRFRITPESAVRYRQKTAERIAQASVDDDSEKVHASYTWHNLEQPVKGKLICLKDGWVMVGDGTWPLYMYSTLIRFADLPTSEQQRASWIFERLLPHEIQQGEDGLRFYLWKRDHR